VSPKQLVGSAFELRTAFGVHNRSVVLLNMLMHKNVYVMADVSLHDIMILLVVFVNYFIVRKLK
jgi:hypothetical protein